MKYYIILALTLATVVMPMKLMAQYPTNCYRDADVDGYGNPNISILAYPSCPNGYVENNIDCNDSDDSIYSGAPELCDSKDNDCDFVIDNDVLPNTYYYDGDRDGYGDPDNLVQACPTPFGYLVNNLDCDDTVFSVNPDAVEVCDGVDNNCDGQIDEGVKLTFYFDSDSDGYGNSGITIQDCSAPVGYVHNSGDCDDSNNTIYPSASELCNGIDDDCDTIISPNEIIDSDLDGFADACDNCPFFSNNQADVDGDLYGDVCDNCPNEYNDDQSDIDDDGIGDVCANNMLPTPISSLVELDFFTINSALDIIIIYDEVITSGYTSITAIDTGTGLPADYVQLGKYYNIETTASYINSIEVCICYSGLGVINEKELYLLHQENNVWIDIASFVDVYNHTICGKTDGFSEFVISEYREEEEEISKDHCFIATAAYGTPLAKEVRILSRFRDTYLLTNPIGCKLVSLYYRLSPPIAGYIKNNAYLKAITRVMLKPMVWLVSNFNTG